MSICNCTLDLSSRLYISTACIVPGQWSGGHSGVCHFYVFAVVPLDGALVGFYRLSVLTMLLSAAVWLQFVMQSCHLHLSSMFAETVSCLFTHISLTRSST